MKKFILLASALCLTFCTTQEIMAQTQQPCPTCPTTTIKKQTYKPGNLKYAGQVRKKKTGTGLAKKYPATYPTRNPSSKYVVYQYVDTTYPNSENHFPLNGNAGIGTPAPQAALEIKRGAGDTRKKNVLLELSNIWAENGQNEPSIMFSNGDNTSPTNVSYWTIGARVSGDKTLNTPQTFKISYKAPDSDVENDFFSVDSYQGRVKIGDVSTQFDGYKLYVEQGILTEKVKVAVKNSDDWFDNVLKQDYKLIPISQLEKYIQDNGHLPDMPTTENVMKNGIDLGKMNGLLLKKVEELTLYLIEIKKELDETKADLDATKKQVQQQEQQQTETNE